MKTKKCTKCEKTRSIKFFNKDRAKKDGLYPSCDDCRRILTGRKKRYRKIVGYIDGMTIVDSGKYYSVSEINVRLHRYLMEKKVGRTLTRSETVHHINGNSKDNREENLILLQNCEHSSLHCKERYKDHTAEAECPVCKSPFIRRAYTKRRKIFCSHSCSSVFKKGKKIKELKTEIEKTCNLK